MYSLILLFTFVAISKAQEVATVQKKKTPIEVRVGFTVSCLDAPYDNEVEASDSKTGFYAGLILEQPLSQRFYIQTGVVVTDKGGKVDGHSIDAIYFQVPIYFSLKLSVNNFQNSIN